MHSVDERILTKHPEGKAGVNSSKEKYDLIRCTIIEFLKTRGMMTFKDLTAEVGRQLEGKFDGSIPWYVTTVKLDLEARGVNKRLPRTSPQQLCLVKRQ